MAAHFLLCLSVLFSLSQALNVTFPASVVGEFESPLLNYDLGPQIQGPTGIIAPLLVSDFKEICTLNRTQVAGKIVYIESKGIDIELVTSDRHALSCIEDFGGVAAIRGIGNTLVPGMWFRFDDGKSRSGNIPIVAVAKKKFQGVVDAATSETVMVDLVVDKNRWVEVWDGTEFFIVFRVILPIINALGACLVLRVLHLHKKRLAKAGKNKTPNNTAKFMMIAACFEFCGFILRCVYCAIGPLFSTNQIPYPSHVFLTNITNPIEVTAMLFAAALFLRFGGMESISEKAQKKLANRVFVLLSVISFVLQLSLSTITVEMPHRSIFFSVINLGYTLVLTLTSSLVFLYQGRLFLKRLGSTVQGRSLSDVRGASIKKAVKWIMLGGTMQFTQIAAIVIAARDPPQFFTPTWFVASYALFYFGLTFAALANTSAFKPIQENTLTATVSRMLKNTISRSGISLSSLRSKKNAGAGSLPSNKSRYIKGKRAEDDQAKPVVHMVHLSEDGELEVGSNFSEDRLDGVEEELSSEPVEEDVEKGSVCNSQPSPRNADREASTVVE